MRLEVICSPEHFIKDIARAEEVCFSEPWSQKALEDFLEYFHNGVIVCVADGHFAGYVTYGSVCGEIQIANVATLPEFRRCGVGQMLIEALVEKGIGNKDECITLEVRSQNKPAISLYEKCGFTAVGMRKNFYKKPEDNALLMKLELP